MSLIIDIKVVPRSGKSMCKLDKAGIVVCYLKSPPERGLANKELIKYIAKELNITQQQVAIIGGATSRRKRIAIDADITQEQLFAALGIEVQLHLL